MARPEREPVRTPARAIARKLRDALVVGGACACALVACATLFAVVATVVGRGLPAIDASFLTEPMRAGGAEGGIAGQLVGTLLLVTTAVVVCAPLAIGVGLTLGFFVRGERARGRIELALYVLGGLPSILFGIAGWIVLGGYCGLGKSWLAGGVVLGTMMLPTAAIALTERIRTLPRKYVDAAAALGLNEGQVVRTVVLPQSLGALLTGLLLGLARAVGETAPIMFTATVFAGASFPDGIRDSPVLALPYHLFVLAQDSLDPALRANVWGTATVLVGVALAFAAIALPWRIRLHEEARDG